MYINNFRELQPRRTHYFSFSNMLHNFSPCFLNLFWGEWFPQLFPQTFCFLRACVRELALAGLPCPRAQWNKAGVLQTVHPLAPSKRRIIVWRKKSICEFLLQRDHTCKSTVQFHVGYGFVQKATFGSSKCNKNGKSSMITQHNR